jgi:ABC-type phosphate/phosphonate transport system substrate-binding protein
MRTINLLLAALLFTTTAGAETYVFTSPPREDPSRGEQVYGPIARHLSKSMDADFVYQHPDNWLSYMKDMQDGRYDLVFDGPHFVSWRVENLSHTPLVRLPGALEFVIVARRGDEQIIGLPDLAGHVVCAHAPPNLATLTLQNQFPNVNRQPQIKAVRGFPNAYKALLDDQCRATVMPVKIYNKLSQAEETPLTRVLFQSRPIPHQAISASPRLPADLQAQVREALLSEEGVVATAKLRERFAGGNQLLPTDADQYRGYAVLLRDFWGFGR